MDNKRFSELVEESRSTLSFVANSLTRSKEDADDLI